MANDDVLLRIESKLDQMLRIIALQSTRELKQTEAIQLLGTAGFERQLIAELLKTTPNTVSVTLSTSKAKRESSRKERTDG
jgi:DNA-binding CsgD family transcriptional regulator